MAIQIARFTRLHGQLAQVQEAQDKQEEEGDGADWQLPLPGVSAKHAEEAGIGE